MESTKTVPMVTDNAVDKDVEAVPEMVQGEDRSTLATSEVFKIEINNLPKHYGYTEFKKMLLQLGLKPKKFKCIMSRNLAYVTFNNEETQQNALTTITDYEWKKQKLSAKIATADQVVDPVTVKRNQAEETEQDPKKPKLSPEESVNAVTPLAHLSYDEQLTTKGEDRSTLDTDPYHYTKRGEFTSEVFKIAIQNLPKHYGYTEFKKLLHKLGLKPKKLKCIMTTNVAFVTFNNEEARQNALTSIKGYEWKKHKLYAKVADPVVDPVTFKRKFEAENTEEDHKKPKLSPEESVVNAVTPLAHLSYDEQLTIKETSMKDFISFLTDKFQRNIPEMRTGLRDQRSANGGECCKLEKIIPSPIVDGYRNKCEFSIGRNQEGKEKIIGFRIGKYKGGHIDVASPLPCRTISPGSMKVVEHMQAYLDQSELRQFDLVSHEGHWSQLTVRTTERSEVMAILQIHPQGLTPVDMEAEKEKLRDYLTSGPGSTAGITSMYLQYIGKSLKQRGFKSNIDLVLGDTHVTEELLGLKFRISQDAFFQVNTRAAEVLFQTVGDWAEVTDTSVLLDVCCGTGTIGLSLAHRVKKVVGVELCKQAVEDAKVNAKNNGIKNATYVCGKAEDVLSSVMQRFNSENVIGIIDPPRAGLHQRVIHSLRRCDGMKRLIYMSCNPYTAWNNFVDLCRPVSIRFKGAPFKLIKAVPVDLFPHAKHCELILLFQRQDPLSDSDTDIQSSANGEEPVSSEGGAATEGPVKSEGPISREGGAATEGPIKSEEGAATEGPIKSEGPVSSEGGAATEGPITSEGPLPSEDCVVTEGPIKSEGPISSKRGAATVGPITTEGGAATEGPIKSEEPVIKEGPITCEDSTT